jgi:hypothetical protein
MTAKKKPDLTDDGKDKAAQDDAAARNITMTPGPLSEAKAAAKEHAKADEADA